MGIVDALDVVATATCPTRGQITSIIALGLLLAVTSPLSCTEMDPTKPRNDARTTRGLEADLSLIQEALRGFIAKNPDNVMWQFEPVLSDASLSGAMGRTDPGEWMIGSWFIRGTPRECVAVYTRVYGRLASTELTLTLKKRDAGYEVATWEVTHFDHE